MIFYRINFMGAAINLLLLSLLITRKSRIYFDDHGSYRSSSWILFLISSSFYEGVGEGKTMMVSSPPGEINSTGTFSHALGEPGKITWGWSL
jgi:hypothetical protein